MRIVNWFCVLRQRTNRLVVSLRSADIGRRKPAIPQGELRQPREARLGDRVVGEGLPRDGVDDGAREPPCQLVWCGNRIERAGATLDARAFIVDQEERLVAAIVERQPDGTTMDEAELFLVKLGLLGVRRIEEVPSIEFFVAEKAKARAVERVRAGLADDVDLVGAEAVLRRIRRRLLLEFLDGVDRKDSSRVPSDVSVFAVPSSM